MTDFFNKQLQFPRVASAFLSKNETIQVLLISKEIDINDFDLFLRVFKHEQKLEVWAKNKNQIAFVLLKSYDFSKSSGTPGPKRQSGDLQIPEGVYQVTNLNPQSAYHLSLRIDYPNSSDLFFADKDNPGNDIYIHGGCVTKGCIAIGDDSIEELFLLVAKVKSTGGVVNVHIFPCDLGSENYIRLKTEYADNELLINFWTNLKHIYNAYEQSRSLSVIYINDVGEYQIKK